VSAPAGPSPEDRVYAGRSSAERRAERRERLIQSGLELFGTIGYDGSSIERICAQAAVSTRYFYDEFSSREELLATVCGVLLEEGGRVVAAAAAEPFSSLEERYGNILRAYIRHVTSDPRRAHVVHRELPSLPALEHRRRAMSATIADYVRDLIGGTAVSDAETGTVFGLAVNGAVTEVLSNWLGQPAPRPPLDLIVEELVAFCTSALAILDAEARLRSDDRHVG
jgi:AcrR family transcriptional regulator